MVYGLRAKAKVESILRVLGGSSRVFWDSQKFDPFVSQLGAWKIMTR